MDTSSAILQQGCINDVGYAAGNGTPDVLRGSHPNNNRVSFLEMLSPENRLQLRPYGIMENEAVKNTD